MQLKKYQKDALDALKSFLEKTRETNQARESFKEVTDGLDTGRYKSEYKPLKELPEVPYVCIRIPTGGGKTILGAHTVKLAGNSYLERDFPVALWLVPSNTIRKQTVEALKNRQHPYRKVLDDAFDGKVRVFDITDFPDIRPTDINDAACVVVGTIQTLRVSNTEGRKVYDHHEALEPHFSRFTAWPKSLEFDEKGSPKFSFSNLLHIHRPILIVDEAHNAVTGLTRETQSRINPACVIEFTATPRPLSNVLFSVSASVLKTEQMIKLPIVLTAHTSWQAAVSGALAERARLAEKAKGEPHYIRPIILFQAQNKDQEVTAEVLKQHLIDNERIPAERIAVVTGEQRELDSINLFKPDCPIEYVITIQALKEGWDCSFAYVFCSVATIKSSTAVEQLLGRVLRMPYAERRREKSLNSAYAHVCDPDFIKAAVELKDKLIEMGFEAEEAEDNVQMPELDLQDGEPLFSRLKVTFELDAPPDMASVSEEAAEYMKIEEKEGGGVVVNIDKPISEEIEKEIIALVPDELKADLKEKIHFVRRKAENLNTPASRKEPFEIPQLCLSLDGEVELAEPELFLDFANWNLLDCEAVLTANEFKAEESFQSFEFDIEAEKERIVYGHLSENVRQFELVGMDTIWDEKSLTIWLDRQCRNPYITQAQRLEFIRRIVKEQLERGIQMGALVRAKYRLAKATAAKIAKCREEAKDKGFQICLFDNNKCIKTDFDYSFKFHEKQYQASSYYPGEPYVFKKHYFGAHRVGDLKNKGEEFECACALDMQPNVKYWVRNLESKPEQSFKLPVAKNWFYPDFVALLDDGRIFVVEYKGAHLIHDPNEKQKKSIGELWEEKSNGKALFLMAEKERDGLKVYEQLKRKIILKEMSRNV